MFFSLAVLFHGVISSHAFFEVRKAFERGCQKSAVLTKKRGHKRTEKFFWRAGKEMNRCNTCVRNGHVWEPRHPNQCPVFSQTPHPCPTYQLSHFPQKFPPKSPKWGPQNEFPGIPQTKGFCGNSTETLISRNFPAHPDLGFWVPISAFWGEMKLISWAALTDTSKVTSCGYLADMNILSDLRG